MWELRESDERTWYRLLYLTQIGNTIYVLHCFEKATAKTPLRDKNLAVKRLQDVRERLRKGKR